MTGRIKKRYWVLTFTLLSIILYLFWGPLFPWNPIKFGYTTINSSKATLYISDITESDSVIYTIEEIIKKQEKIHGLSYKDNFKIVVLDKETSMKRFVPWLKGNGYSVSLSSLNLIYIGPIARKIKDGLEPYLKHELSHLLIGQNTTLANGLVIHNQGWFAEGLAEYVSGHKFHDKNLLRMLVDSSNITFKNLDENNPLKMTGTELKLKYSYYGYFVEFLVDNYGHNKLRKFIKRYIFNPENYREIFKEIYLNNIDRIMEKFNSQL